MRLITLTILFFIPLFGFASYPIQINIPTDTIIETKKETMEEYNIRIQKQLYDNSEKNKYETNNWTRVLVIFGVLVIIFLILIIRWAKSFNQFDGYGNDFDNVP